MERIKISKEVLNIILHYLSNRPYKEVAAIVKAVQEDLEKNKGEENESQN